MIAGKAEVREIDSLRAVADDGVNEFGQIDVIIANAGIVSYAPILELDEAAWQSVIDINLTGVWKTMKAVVPTLIERNKGWIHRPHQLSPWVLRLAQRRSLRVGQTRHDGMNAFSGTRVGPARHPGQCTPTPCCIWPPTSRYVTGTATVIDAGASMPVKMH
jgi:NAD(P)-dependent dehydrogenase (short-subunit alcohol dehydrogenase family)